MNARRARECLLVVAALAGTVNGLTSSVHAQGAAPAEQKLREIETAAQELQGAPLRGREPRTATFVEERFQDGKLFYQMRDYVRASIVLSDVVDNHPQHPVAPEALFWLGESLYAVGEPLGARARFRALIARANEPAYSPFVAGALGRLIEISINTRDFDGVDSYFEKLRGLPAGPVQAAAAYFRAKYLYNLAVPTEDVTRGGTELKTATVDTQKLETARVAFEGVAESSPFYGQAQYFVGTIYTLQRQFPQAIEAFRRALRAPNESPEQEQVVQLSQLALGRLLYETQQLALAVEAYEAVPSDSEWYDSALYEIAWVYLRMGDATKAESALETLATEEPESLHLADANILRGNLLIRNGRRPEATAVFEESVETYGPVRQKLDQIIAEHADAPAYFRQLVRENIQVFDASTMLPSEAVGFASDDVDLQRALGQMNNLSQTRSILDDTVRLARRLDGAIHAPNAANVFPDLKRERERIVATRNRAVLVIMALIGLEEKRTPGNLGDLGTIRAERHGMEPSLAQLPVDRAGFRNKDKELLDRFAGLATALYKLEAAIRSEDLGLDANDRFEFSREIDELQLEVEAQRMQVGVGDPRYVLDDRLRQRYKATVERERAMLVSMGVQPDASTDSMFRRVASVEASLAARDAEVDRVLAERVSGMNSALAVEAANLATYQQELAALETEAEQVVGSVAYTSFLAVRGRVYDLVLRADLGIVDVSWAEREEHRKRVESLTRQRAYEIRALDEEFQEIMDEPMSGGQQ